MTSIFFTRTCHIVKRFGQTIQEGKLKGRLTSLTSRSRLVIDEIWSVAHCRHLQGICFAHQTSRKPAVPYEHAQLSKIQIISIRHKKKKASSSPVEDGDDSDGSEDDDEQGNDFKVLKGNVNSTRIDSVLKFALGMSRNKVENAFYSNSIYLNGERLDKKKHSVTIEDEVDVVRGLNTLNPSFIDVHRVEVLDIQRSRTDPDKLVIKVKRFKRLTIDNYARPWKPPASE